MENTMRNRLQAQFDADQKHDNEMAVMFMEMDHKELVFVALQLMMDAQRLRRELDEKNGVIR